MSRDIEFTDPEAAIEADFLNDAQEVLTGLAIGLRLDTASSTQVRLKGDNLTDDSYSVRIEGKPRYGDAAQTVSVSGSAGEYGVWVTAGSGSTPKAPTLEVSSGTPAQPHTRQIGTVTWSGSAITNLRLTNGIQANADQYNSFVFRPLVAAATPLTIKGVSGQTGDLLRIQSHTGSSLLRMSPSALSVTGSATISGTAAIGGNLSVGTAGTQSSLLMVNANGQVVTLRVNASNQLVIS